MLLLLKQIDSRDSYHKVRARLKHAFARISSSSFSNYLNHNTATVPGQEGGGFWFCSAQNSVLLPLKSMTKLPLNSVEAGLNQRLLTKAVLFAIAGVWDAGDAFRLCAHFLWLIRAVAFGFSAPGCVFAIGRQQCFMGSGAYCATRQMFQ